MKRIQAVSLFLSLLSVERSVRARECTVGTDGTCIDESAAAASAAASSSSNRKQPKRLECGVYMAPSTLGEDTNMGIYTGIPLKNGDVVNFPEIAIPLLFREWADHKPGYDDGVLWDRYLWEGDVMDIETYEDTDRFKSRAVFVPGVGCTVNSVLDMNNIKSTHGSVYDTAGLHRSKDPGSAAFAPYHSAVTEASTDIAPGAELFASYGDYWIPDIPGAQVTLEERLDEAETFLQERYLPWIEQHGDRLSEELKEGLWEFMTQEFSLYSQHRTNLPRAKWTDVEQVYHEHLQETSDEEEEEEEFSLVRHFIRNQSIRSLEWLDEHGYCQDHLKPGLSTIVQAGRGAFATRDLPAGTVVGYAPLVHIGHYGKEIFTIEYEHDKERPPMLDLILNYSFGHRNSTVILTPYGGMVNYINHSKEKANVKIRWPNKELVAHKPSWLKQSPQFLRDTTDKIGLSFEYVAMRDIAEGEEVFMNYGDEWEDAWKKYIQEWKPVDGAESYVHSTQWKEKHFRTQAELETNPYPPNLITMCHESFTTKPDGTYEWLPVLRASQYRIYCDVLERHEQPDRSEPQYTVRMHLDEGGSVDVQNVRPDGIFLYDKAFSQDWHLPNAFRHEIMIPDDVIPKAWLNGPPEKVLYSDEQED